MTARTNDIGQAAGLSRAGRPTETVSGPGADAEEAAAVSRVFQARGIR